MPVRNNETVLELTIHKQWDLLAIQPDPQYVFNP